MRGITRRSRGESMSQVRSLVAKQRDNAPDIDLGLSVLCALAKPGQTLSLRDIAEVCDCSKQVIHCMEKAAMEKIRAIGARKGLPEYLREDGGR